MQTIEEQFKTMVRRLLKSAEEIRSKLTTDEINIINAVIKLNRETAHILFNFHLSPIVLSAVDIGWFDNFHAAIGMQTEAGELLDAMKKLYIYRKADDPDKLQKCLENLLEELGDFEFYMQAFQEWDFFEEEKQSILKSLDFIRISFGYTREAILCANIHKLTDKDKGRYQSGTYSDEAAHNRNDKLKDK